MRTQGLDVKSLEIDGVGASGGVNDNLFINGNFDIWQRGTSYSGPISVTYCSADRWIFYDGQNGTANISKQVFSPGQTDVPGGPINYAQYDMTVQATEGGPGIHQRIENVAIAQAEPVTFSFYAKLTSGTLVVTPFVVQSFGSSGSSLVQTSYTSQTLTLTSSWAKHTVTLDIPSISGKTVSGGDDYLQIGFQVPLSSGTFTLSITNMKAEKGSVATPFVSRPIAEELALCQRYYVYTAVLNSAGYHNTSSVISLAFVGSMSFPTTMRVAPTSTILTEPSYTNCSDASITATAWGCLLRVLTSASGNYRAISGVYDFDAEL